MLTGTTLSDAGLDAVALKPSECDVAVGADIDADLVCIDYEGRDHLPDPATLRALAEDAAVRVTTPVRAAGFDPLGDDGLLANLPASVGRILVAGHGAYLDEDERRKPVAPRLSAAATACPDPWVGTESVERVALAVGGTQFELLSRTTERDLRALRQGGFEGDLAVYAPTVLADSEDAVLDAVGEYAARRKPVRTALPQGAATDAAATGRAREVLAQAVRDYALVGSAAEVREQAESLREAGADRVVAYPAQGPGALQ